MPDFAYRAIDGRGRTVRGAMAAVNEADLEARLRQLELDLVTARSVRVALLARLFTKPVAAVDLIQFCIHMEQLLRAGVPLVDGLADVRAATDSGRFRDVVSALFTDVRDGAMLSRALACHPGVFGDVFVGLVSAGEETGSLADSFAELARHLRWLDELRGRVRRALRYPTVLALLLLAVIALMMGYVVPRVVGYLHEIGAELPWLTVALIETSAFFVSAWPLLIGVPAVIAVATVAITRASPAAARRFDAAKLRLPLIGPVLRKLALSRFTHFFSLLFGSGVAILTCLATARNVVGNRSLAEALDRVAEGVSTGQTLARSLEATGAFPGLVVRMVKVGEDTGRLLETLDNVTYFYDREVDEAVSGMIGALEPAVTVVLGALLAWVAVAVLGPIYDSFGAIG